MFGNLKRGQHEESSNRIEKVKRLEEKKQKDIKENGEFFSREFEHVDGAWPGFVCLPFNSSSRCLARVREHALCIHERDRTKTRDPPVNAATTQPKQHVNALAQINQLYSSSEDEYEDEGDSASTRVATSKQHKGAGVTAQARAIMHSDNHMLDPHISISRPFALRSHQIQPFVALLASEVVRAFGLAGTCIDKGSSAAATYVDISSRVYTLYNDTGRRGFLCLPVERDYSKVLPILVKATDAALRAFQKEGYYEGARFHISIASFVVDTNIDIDVEEENERRGGDVALDAVTVYTDSDDDDNDKRGDNESEKAHLQGRHLMCAQELQYMECRLGNRIFRMHLPLTATSSFAEIAV